MKLELEDDLGAVNAEIRRVGTIRHMMESGQHDDALRELLRDTDSDLPYFHRLRRQLSAESGEQQQQPRAGRNQGQGGEAPGASSDACAGAGSAPGATRPPSSPPPAKPCCQWLGVDPQTGCKYHCVNICATHPWKVSRNVYGDEEALRMDFCAYHVRYCLDPRHTPRSTCASSGGTGGRDRECDDLIEIHCPNEHGLCNGCYVQRLGHRPPVPGSCRIPGRRRIG